MGNLLSSWKAKAALALATIVAGMSALDALVGGIESLRDVRTWLIWAFERANTPWLGVFMLIFVGCLLWSGLKDIGKAAERGNAKDRKAAQQETRIRQEALDEMERRMTPVLNLVHDLKRLAVEESRLNELERCLWMGERLIQDCEKLLASLPGTAFDGDINTQVFECARDTLSLCRSTSNLQNPIAPFAPLPSPVGYLQEGEPSGGPVMYDVEKNAHYEMALREWLEALRRGRDNLEGMVQKSREEQGRILRNIGA